MVRLGKDKIPYKERKGVIYKIDCIDCDACYIGDPSRKSLLPHNLLDNIPENIPYNIPCKVIFECYEMEGSVECYMTHSIEREIKK